MKAHYLGHVVFYVKDLERSLALLSKIISLLVSSLCQSCV